MKINQGLQRTSKYKPNNRINLDHSSMNHNFSDFMQEKERQYSRELLDKMLDEIDEQGKKLGVSKNIRELKAYKALVRKFLEEAIKMAILLENQSSYDHLGRTKKYKILKAIDKKLLELTDDALKKENKQINILDQIGEIRGMLVNLYF